MTLSHNRVVNSSPRLVVSPALRLRQFLAIIRVRRFQRNLLKLARLARRPELQVVARNLLLSRPKRLSFALAASHKTTRSGSLMGNRHRVASSQTRETPMLNKGDRE